MDFQIYQEKRITSRALKHKLIYEIPSPENNIVQYIQSNQRNSGSMNRINTHAQLLINFTITP